MVCEEKMRLIVTYVAATERLAIAVAKLRQSTDEEFDEAFIVSEMARTECGKARRAIQEHRVQHGC
jgi:hypothetical protein